MFNHKPQNKLSQIAPASKEKIVLGQLVLAIAFSLLAFSSCSTASSYRKGSAKQVMIHCSGE